MPLAYIGLGSNLSDPARQVGRALGAIAALPASRLTAASRLYRSPPMGPKDQPDYINAVAALETTLTPHDLLHALQTIEHDFGRVRLRRWGERIIDLDLLLYDNVCLDAPELTLPHPGIGERAFVLRPLAEIAPDLVIPGLGPLANLLAACAVNTCVPLEEDV
ncbi:MAG: 2-amino-4-hydroxy-6-hydroxymethyldihydropteridine diphosphokinase [Halothiobacillaceae bacterium]